MESDERILLAEATHPDFFDIMNKLFPLLNDESVMSMLRTKAELRLWRGSQATGSGAPVIRLEQQNAHAAGNVYRTLGASQIRLVTICRGQPADPIHCTLRTVDLRSTGTYFAISYVWGSQNDPKTILLDGTPWLITSNLEFALRRLRAVSQDVVVWIDALAINQSDMQERSHQVANMHEIFAGAERTVLSFGPDFDEITSLFCELARVIASYPVNSIEFSSGVLLGLTATCVVLDHLSYWPRVWVVQEIMYSRRIEVLHACGVLPYSYLILLWDVIQARVTQSFESDSLTKSAIIYNLSVTGPRRLPEEASALRGRRFSLEEWQNAVRHGMEATDPRDYIYSYRNCYNTDVRDAIPIDYTKPWRDVWIQMAQTFVAHVKSLDIIYSNMHTKELDLPSWVPEWRVPDRYEVQQFLPPSKEGSFKSASSSFPLSPGLDENGHVLRVPGKLLGVVENIARRSHSAPERTTTTKTAQLTEWTEKRNGEVLNYYSECADDFNIERGGIPEPLFTAAFVAGYEELLEKVGSLSQETPHISDDFKRQVSHMMGHHVGRRMFSWIHGEKITTFYGLGPNNIKIGDCVCVLARCQFPLILRKSMEYYTVVGSAHVPGFMDGEAVEAIVEGKAEPSTFAIR